MNEVSVKDPKQQHQSALYMGIDGGGSHCRAMLQDARGNLLGQGQGGPANPVYGLQQSIDSILTATHQALDEAGLASSDLSNIVVGGGLAGLHLPRMQEAMQKWQHPFAALYLTTDLHAAALGAHQGMDGGVIILGTGFSSLASCKGKLTQVGGYGFPINATCSGSWFGLEAVKAVLLDVDGVGLSTSLTQALLMGRSATELAEDFMHATATDYAKLAPLVFEQADIGDKVSLGLIQQGAAFINQVIRRLLATGVTRLAMIGGITERIKPWLDPQLLATINTALASPQQGALLYARQQHALVTKDKS
ncbi:BadF/BadG/BcrA/BcrD ATPase family protein [Bowmanella denitrificans]|uniref:BadF/BadG/BcrA/BcrD ATPase family protein n=1 Tax=Bowmanella denitrificans TaxID=366582 RepID=A0ABP3GAW1_9ALTE